MTCWQRTLCLPSCGQSSLKGEDIKLYSVFLFVYVLVCTCSLVCVGGWMGVSMYVYVLCENLCLH